MDINAVPESAPPTVETFVKEDFDTKPLSLVLQEDFFDESVAHKKDGGGRLPGVWNRLHMMVYE